MVQSRASQTNVHEKLVVILLKCKFRRSGSGGVGGTESLVSKLPGDARTAGLRATF